MNRAYYAIIPANIRYDSDLAQGAKILYGEITALCNEKGYCWATNSYFSELYNVSKRTISRWINCLVDKEYIYSKINYKKGSNEIESRWLYVTPPRQKCQKGIDKNVKSPRQKCQKGIDKNVLENNTYINNTINTTTNKENCSYGSSFNIYIYMQQRGFVSISSVMAEQIQADIEMYSLEEVKQAIDIADNNGKHTYSYVKGILENRRNKGNSKSNTLDVYDQIINEAKEKGVEPF